MTRSADHLPNHLPPAERLRIVVLGFIVRGPLGGMATAYLQYFQGLSALGHEVYFVDDGGDYPYCYNPVTYECDVNPEYGLRFAADCFHRIGFPDRWAYYDGLTRRWHGPAADRILGFCAEADVVFNLFLCNSIRPWMQDIPVRVAVEGDAPFTQIKNLTKPEFRAITQGHTHFRSMAENIGGPGCLVPDDGFPWRPTRSPILLSTWPAMPAPAADAPLTTVMQWKAYPSLQWNGVSYGNKREAIEPFHGLPGVVAERLEVAVSDVKGDEREALERRGWKFRDPGPITKDPWTYQQYIQSSRGEFSVAKHGYVVSRTGWFSERSACYMASGRPVVVQDTGFTDWLPVGEGVVAFSGFDEAVEAIGDLRARYSMHCRSARAIAESFFDSKRILTGLIEDVMSATPAASTALPS